MTAPSPAMHFHASAVTLRGRGILIAGQPGSGKTRLALTLLREALGFGHPAALVSDDQVLLSVDGNGLRAETPPALGGLVEIRGFGIARIPFEPACTVDLLVRLVPDAPRMAPEEAWEEVAGCRLPRLDLAERDAAGAALAVNAFLFGAPW